MTDGPFTESKELVASYALFEVKDMDEAVMWTKRFLECIGKATASSGRSSIRQTSRPDVFPAEQVAREQAWRNDMDQTLAKGNRNTVADV